MTTDTAASLSTLLTFHQAIVLLEKAEKVYYALYEEVQALRGDSVKSATPVIGYTTFEQIRTRLSNLVAWTQQLREEKEKLAAHAANIEMSNDIRKLAEKILTTN